MYGVILYTRPSIAVHASLGVLWHSSSDGVTRRNFVTPPRRSVFRMRAQSSGLQPGASGTRARCGTGRSESDRGSGAGAGAGAGADEGSGDGEDGEGGASGTAISGTGGPLALGVCSSL